MADDSENPLPPVSAAKTEDGIAKSPDTKKRKIDSLRDGEPEDDGISDQHPVEVEQVRQDEFEFLDGATRLAVLQAGMVSLLLVPLTAKRDECSSARPHYWA